MQSQRLAALDGLRAIAILMVVGYHYFSRWTELYPYGAALERPFAFGYLGVWLFFIISGFVIALTLESCRSFGEFALRRFARLWPPMLVGSIATFAVLALLAPPLLQQAFHFSPANFLPSLTFIDPGTLEKVLHAQTASMDGAYWSLYVEVRFYFWAALLFFAFRRRLVLAFLLFINAVALADSVTHHLVATLFAPQYMPLFGIGLGFYYLYRDRGHRLAALLVLNAAALGLARMEPAEWPAFAVFLGLFALFTWRPAWLAPLAWKPLAALGQASYSLYLLHQYAGVTLIVWLASALGLEGRAALPVALAVAAGMAGIALALYRVWEIPARDLISRRSSRARRWTSGRRFAAPSSGGR